MDIRIIAILLFSYLYAFFEFGLSRMGKKSRTLEKSGDQGSFWILILSIVLGYTLAFTVGRTHLGRVAPWNLYFGIGILLVLCGLYLRIRAVRTLRQQFTYRVSSVSGQQLIEKGPYRVIRHPGYLGQLMIFLGIATALSNWLSVLGMMVPVFAGFLYRIHVEERFLLREMGDRYRDYSRRTKKLIPYLF
ncbi:MAG: isoprenylcysteine carboxylmethyltransferase family protein [Marinilabiliales bacterium]|nr:isoprenylcysteine carboxylmethyltransferase family protein [Marinilabiliales bacterium]